MFRLIGMGHAAQAQASQAQEPAALVEKTGKVD
jgi:hypothetical protein